VNCDVPRVYQLRVTVSNDGSRDQKTLPESAAAELGFPSSVTLVLPNSRSGAVNLLVEALDKKPEVVGTATVSGQIAVGDRIDLQVQLKAVSTSTCGNGLLEAGEECDDGNTISGDGCSSTCRIETSSTSGDSGARDGGSLEDGGTTRPPDLAPTGTGMSFVQVAVGTRSTCAVRSNGGLWCWGSNMWGQLGVTGTSNHLTPVVLQGNAWSQVACGQSHSCAIRGDTTLSCWGYNGSGQLATTALSEGQLQADVPGAYWQSVATGMYQTCAIKQDATLWCWGDNGNGQLGDGNALPSNDPVQVVGDGWRQASTSYLHTCAVKTDGTLWCWGNNANGQVGDSNKTSHLVPNQIVGTGWTQVTTGEYHTCGVKQDGTLWCWGGNALGELGNDSIAALPDSQTNDPVQVLDASGRVWQSVSAGGAHTCAIAVDGSIACWGDNTDGQLGDNTQILKTTPVDVVAVGETWTAVAAAYAHT
jgi:cysteine-rich repeat protein